MVGRVCLLILLSSPIFILPTGIAMPHMRQAVGWELAYTFTPCRHIRWPTHLRPTGSPDTFGRSLGFSKDDPRMLTGALAMYVHAERDSYPGCGSLLCYARAPCAPSSPRQLVGEDSGSSRTAVLWSSGPGNRRGRIISDAGGVDN
jgi:hypothetical protein